MNITERLYGLADRKYAAFQSKLTPGIDPDLFIGVRVPVLRKFAKEYVKEEEHTEFMASLPHRFYDENMLHGLLIEQIKDPEECIRQIDAFLPYVDNWAVCDIMSPKCLKKNRQQLLEKIRQWTASDKVYTCRFGMEMLMTHFLDDDFEKEYLDIPLSVKSEEYYVNMMTAWFFATALTKQWESTVPYINERKLPVFVHNKTIQKACESYRIPDERKSYLRTFKIK